MKPKKSFLFVFFSIITSLSNAQSGFVSLGATISNQQGSISYSIGQSAFVNSKSNEGSMEFGLQQPYQYISVTSIPGINSAEGINIFPNPTRASLLITGLNRLSLSDKMSAQIVSQSGQILKQYPISNTALKIDVKNLNPGTYFLTMIQNYKILNVYKFIKL
jgi:hypothetical protein